MNNNPAQIRKYKYIGYIHK